MVWQDWVISISSILFVYSLSNQVWYGFKKKKGFLTIQASVLTTIGLYAVAISFFFLNLYFSAVLTLVNATLWLTLFLQRLKYGKA